jgi:hypothetical protein
VKEYERKKLIIESRITVAGKEENKRKMLEKKRRISSRKNVREKEENNF